MSDSPPLADLDLRLVRYFTVVVAEVSFALDSHGNVVPELAHLVRTAWSFTDREGGAQAGWRVLGGAGVLAGSKP